MRIALFVPIVMLVTFFESPAFAQSTTPRDLLAAAELIYPDSLAPRPFAPGSASALYAGEAEDRNWSADTEAGILEAVEIERERGLVIRRVEVECRTATCAVLLIHAADRSDGSVGHLIETLKGTFGFTGVSRSAKEIREQIISYKLKHDENIRGCELMTKIGFL